MFSYLSIFGHQAFCWFVVMIILWFHFSYGAFLGAFYCL
ncbi:unnamed protein product [Acidithrix sp. C25]|nr:unnamed protein product [Acidithrix sp. C25]